MTKAQQLFIREIADGLSQVANMLVSGTSRMGGCLSPIGTHFNCLTN